MSPTRLAVLLIVSRLLIAATTATSSQQLAVPAIHMTTSKIVGAVYAMTNDVKRNSILAYGRQANGTLSFLRSYRTRGRGAVLDNGDGIDPLISAYSVVFSKQNRFLLCVNAGSSTLTVFEVRPDFKLSFRSVQKVEGFGPVSIATFGRFVYVASADSDGDATALLDQKGVLSGFTLTASGNLVPIRRSIRELSARPAAIQFSTDGSALIVAQVNAGSSNLNTTTVDELLSYRVSRTGLLSEAPIDSVASTKLNNREGRNLPNGFGFEIVTVNGAQYVVVTEVRALGSDGMRGRGQTSSVSTWSLTDEQKLEPVQLDLLVGRSVLEGQRAACWIEFSRDFRHYWITNTASGTISSFSFSAGRSKLVAEIEAVSPAPIDLWISADGRFLYVLSNGQIDIFRISRNGRGAGLSRIQTVRNLPKMNVQGIIAM